MTTDQTIWYDGTLMPMSEANCSLLEHGLHYGTGVFEGIRCYDTPSGPAVFRLDEHLKRLQKGADVLGMEFDWRPLKDAVRAVLSANAHGEAYIRPIVFYGAGSLGLDVGGAMPTHTAVASMEWSSHLGQTAKLQGVSLLRSAVRRVPATSMPPLKLCGAYVNSVLAKRAAAQAGCDEALFVDEMDWVCEATGENVFIVNDGHVTAVSHPDALPGITRQTVIELTNATSRKVSYQELLEADEVFLTGTSAEVAPVRQLDGYDKLVGPVTREVQNLYARAVTGTLPGYARWLTTVDSCAA
jgi:branched-chain amino acid aminotransferase